LPRLATVTGIGARVRQRRTRGGKKNMLHRAQSGSFGGIGVAYRVALVDRFLRISAAVERSSARFLLQRLTLSACWATAALLIQLELDRAWGGVRPAPFRDRAVRVIRAEYPVQKLSELVCYL